MSSVGVRSFVERRREMVFRRMMHERHGVSFDEFFLDSKTQSWVDGILHVDESRRLPSEINHLAQAGGDGSTPKKNSGLKSHRVAAKKRSSLKPKVAETKDEPVDVFIITLETLANRNLKRKLKRKGSTRQPKTKESTRRQLGDEPVCNDRPITLPVLSHPKARQESNGSTSKETPKESTRSHSGETCNTRATAIPVLPHPKARQEPNDSTSNETPKAVRKTTNRGVNRGCADVHKQSHPKKGATSETSKCETAPVWLAKWRMMGKDLKKQFGLDDFTDEKGKKLNRKAVKSEKKKQIAKKVYEVDILTNKTVSREVSTPVVVPEKQRERKTNYDGKTFKREIGGDSDTVITTKYDSTKTDTQKQSLIPLADSRSDSSILATTSKQVNLGASFGKRNVEKHQDRFHPYGGHPKRQHHDKLDCNNARVSVSTPDVFKLPTTPSSSASVSKRHVDLLKKESSAPVHQGKLVDSECNVFKRPMMIPSASSTKQHSHHSHGLQTKEDAGHKAKGTPNVDKKDADAKTSKPAQPKKSQESELRSELQKLKKMPTASTYLEHRLRKEKIRIIAERVEKLESKRKSNKIQDIAQKVAPVKTASASQKAIPSHVKIDNRPQKATPSQVKNDNRPQKATPSHVKNDNRPQKVTPVQMKKDVSVRQSLHSDGVESTVCHRPKADATTTSVSCFGRRGDSRDIAPDLAQALSNSMGADRSSSNRGVSRKRKSPSDEFRDYLPSKKPVYTGFVGFYERN